MKVKQKGQQEKVRDGEDELEDEEEEEREDTATAEHSRFMLHPSSAMMQR